MGASLLALAKSIYYSIGTSVPFHGGSSHNDEGFCGKTTRFICRFKHKLWEGAFSFVLHKTTKRYNFRNIFADLSIIVRLQKRQHSQKGMKATFEGKTPSFSIAFLSVVLLGHFFSMRKRSNLDFKWRNTKGTTGSFVISLFLCMILGRCFSRV